jgi:hypothetical protein
VNEREARRQGRGGRGTRRCWATAWPAASCAAAHRRGPLPSRGRPRTRLAVVPAVTHSSAPQELAWAVLPGRASCRCEEAVRRLIGRFGDRAAAGLLWGRAGWLRPASAAGLDGMPCDVVGPSLTTLHPCYSPHRICVTVHLVGKGAGGQLHDHG